MAGGVGVRRRAVSAVRRAALFIAAIMAVGSGVPMKGAVERQGNLRTTAVLMAGGSGVPMKGAVEWQGNLQTTAVLMAVGSGASLKART